MAHRIAYEYYAVVIHDFLARVHFAERIVALGLVGRAVGGIEVVQVDVCVY